MTTPDSEWWKLFYDDLLADMLLEQTTPAEIEQAVDFLVNALNLKAGQRAFDQCCGSGRLSIALAKRGIQVVGVDLAPNYIDRARAKARSNGLEIEFQSADAFSFTAAPLADAVFNWWTSFGYAADDDQNVEMLRRAWESLRPGGRFALDFMNVPGLYRHFQPYTVTRGASGDGEVLLIRESELRVDLGVIHKHWTYVLQDGHRVEHRTKVRLYDPPTLRRLFAEAGFQDIQMFGDTDGSRVTLNSPRCIVVAQKPEHHS